MVEAVGAAVGGVDGARVGSMLVMVWVVVSVDVSVDVRLVEAVVSGHSIRQQVSGHVWNMSRRIRRSKVQQSST